MDEKAHRPERRGDDPWVTKILETVEALDVNIKTLKIAVDAIDAQTREMRELWTALEGGIKILHALGVFAKWTAGIVAGVAAAWYAVKHGGNTN